MAEEFPLLNTLNESETKTILASINTLEASYYYFLYLQETVLIALDNGGAPLVVKKTENNPIILALVTTTKAFSVAKAAMDQCIRGYPSLGFAISRLLSELLQTTQYLVRHPNLIDGFLSGQAKLDRVLKLAKKEAEEGPAFFSELRGIQSRFSHAGREFLGIGLQTSGNRMSANLIVYDEELLDNISYGIVGSLFVQYMIFRFITKGITNVEEVLKERDLFIFDPGNVRKYLGLETLSDDFLTELFDWFKSN